MRTMHSEKHSDAGQGSTGVRECAGSDDPRILEYGHRCAQ